MKIPPHLMGIIATQHDLDMLVMRVQKLEDRPDPATHIDSLWKRIENMDRDLLFVINQVNELERGMKAGFKEVHDEISELKIDVNTLGPKIDVLETKFARMERNIVWLMRSFMDIMGQLKMKPPPLEDAPL